MVATRRTPGSRTPIASEKFAELARWYWAPGWNDQKPFDAKVISQVYKDLVGSSFTQRKIVQLEFSQYLEQYLWKNFTPATASRDYVLSIVIMVNEKFRERVPAWQCFARQPEHFQALFALVIELSLNKELSFLEQSSVISFVDNCFNSLEVDCVRQEVMKLCSLTVWSNLLPSQRSDILGSNPKLKKLWAKMEKKLGSLPEEELKKVDFNRNLLWKLLQRLKEVVDLIDQSIEAGEEGKEFDVNAVTYCERLLLLFIDLECQLTTRRFFNRLLLDSHVIVHCSLSKFIENEIGSLSCELLSMLKFYARFEIDDVTGAPLTQTEMMKKHYGYVTRLQKACFKFFRDNMSEFSLLNVGSVDTRRFLKQQFSSLSSDELYQIAEYLLLVPSKDDKESLQKNYARYDDTQYLAEMIIFHCERRPSQLQKINAQPLYPSEKVIWDEKLVPYEQYDGESVLPLNKLNLQFLTIHDYLLRNFNLFQMESTYEVRQDLEDALFRMKPWLHESGAEEVVWGGWARMALPIAEARIFNIAKPLVGESAPAEVAMNVTVNLPKRVDLRFEWESLRKNDVLFLVKVKGTKPVGTKFDFRQPFKDQFEVITVRGCEVEGMLGPDERVIDEMESREVRRQLTGDSRTYRIKLDPNQYQIDMDNGKEADIYFSFNLLVRRDPKANNFKAVLATVRQLLNTELVVPDWLNDVILGYGEPDSAHYSKINNTVASVDFNDTFLSYEHLVEAFPEHKVICEEEKPEPPFALTFKEFIPQHDVDEAQRDKSIVVSSRRKNRVSLFEHGQYRQNHIRFTPAQVEAIKAGMQPGLTMVVGPPGTGKTDVAVQIISNIYHNWPEQRTLIVTHSNQALNQLFEKIIALDVDERHLLRLGHGEEALETEKDFTRYGRVNYVLKARLELLKEVERLKDVLGEIGDVGYSCETAGYFYRYTVYRNWEEFKQKLETAKQAGEVPATFVSENFPFTKFFEGRTLFKGESFQEDLDVAEDCWKFITGIFKKLEEFRAFELLRNGRDRSFYLLVKEAKIIAMTCTHAALRRKELVELGFRYDNILMEESAQILEVETFIPLLLQDPSEGRHRLKRWIMIGDHHQLPPIVQNVAYQKYANMEQSLFARFIRLGVPYIELDAQGRARDEIARLYNWRYKKLGDLPHIQALPEYNTVNAGFAYNYQLIDVPDFNGVGETTPSPYFYQFDKTTLPLLFSNLGEAEYAVALFVYMRVLGYPREKISILTTYNGQASLLRDIIRKKCADNPLIGEPRIISTVDKYQGQQNDYIILSLVRTNLVGHIRDIRRLIVALSRARLGLYIFGRVSLFRNCFELTPAFNRLCERPTRLQLVPNETYDSPRKLGDKPQIAPVEIVDTMHMSQFVNQFYTANLELLQARFAEEVKRLRPPALDKPEEPAKEPEEEKPEEASAEPAEGAQDPKKKKEDAEGAIVFEEVDFERLQEMPNYG